MHQVVELFYTAEKFLKANGFAQEIEWCDNRPSFDQLSEKDFFREYTWVVFNSGMRNAVVEAKWRELSEAFLYFNSLKVLEDQDQVLQEALKVFGNHKKVLAVIETAQKICEEGYLHFSSRIKENPLEILSSLPFIGEVTKFHLARNLGFDYIKPDRHLVKLASKYGMTPFELCDRIHKETGRRLGTIDVVLWRFCEQQGQAKFAGGLEERWQK